MSQLLNYETAEYIREATEAEKAESHASGYEGVITVEIDGIETLCYVP